MTITAAAVRGCVAPALLALALAGGISCSTVPLTGRKQLNLVPESEMLSMSFHLIFMAMAGYDPNGALDFWQRMAAAGKGKAPPEIMSTHPSDETRIAQIRQNLPEALKYYRPVR